MGCDIHISVCVRNPKTNKFVPLAMTDYGYRSSVVEPYTGRYYQLFGVLANVRCDKLAGIGYYPKDRFDIDQIEWPFLEYNKKIANIEQANSYIEMLCCCMNGSEPEKSDIPFTRENVAIATDIYGFRNTFDYFSEYLHSHTWFTLKQLKKLKEQLEHKLAELEDKTCIDEPVDIQYSEDQWSEVDEVAGVINALDELINNTKSMVKLHCNNIYCEEKPKAKDILVLIAFDS